MDYKYIEQLLERYWDAETTLEEENILRTFFRQKMHLGDDFDARILKMIGEEQKEQGQQPVAVKAREIKLTQRLMPLFKAAAVVAIILTLGNAIQKPWDASWNDSPDMTAGYKQQVDTVIVTPVQAENIETAVDSTKAGADLLPKD